MRLQRRTSAEGEGGSRFCHRPERRASKYWERWRTEEWRWICTGSERLESELEEDSPASSGEAWWLRQRTTSAVEGSSKDGEGEAADAEAPEEKEDVEETRLMAAEGEAGPVAAVEAAAEELRCRFLVLVAGAMCGGVASVRD